MIFSRTIVEHFFDKNHTDCILELLVTRFVDSSVTCVVSRIKLGTDETPQPKEVIFTAVDTAAKDESSAYKLGRHFLLTHDAYSVEPSPNILL